MTTLMTVEKRARIMLGEIRFSSGDHKSALRLFEAAGHKAGIAACAAKLLEDGKVESALELFRKAKRKAEMIVCGLKLLEEADKLEARDRKEYDYREYAVDERIATLHSMALRTFKETGHTAGIFSYLASRIEKKLYGQEFKRLVTPLLSELTPDEHERLAFVALQGGEYALYEFAFPYFKAAGHTLGLIECGNAMLRLQGFNSEPVIEAFVLSGYRPGLLACVKIALETGRSWVALRAAAAAGETLTRAQLLDCAVRAPNEELAIDAILEVLKLDDVTPRQEEAGE